LILALIEKRKFAIFSLKMQKEEGMPKNTEWGVKRTHWKERDLGQQAVPTTV